MLITISGKSYGISVRSVKMQKANARWYKLDNAAKIYPVVYSKTNSGTFIVAANLYEPVIPKLLQDAINKLLPRFPMFRVKLKKGLFWYYLNYNYKPFIIKPATDDFCGHIRNNNDYLFEVLYRNNTITLHIFHSLTDGTGAITFLKSIVYKYLNLKGYQLTPDNLIITEQSVPTGAELEDSYLKYYNKSNRKTEKERLAFQIKGEPLNFGGTGAILGWLKTSQLHDLAKTNNATITAYLTAVIIYSIYQTQIKGRTFIKESTRPVKVLVPVNLRIRMFSLTLRNFAGFIKVGMQLNRENITFEEILQTVKNQLTEQINTAAYSKYANSYVYFEKNFFLRICPLVLKNLIIKLAYHFIGNRLNTVQFSNLGVISFPESVQPYIKSIQCALGASKTSLLNCMACSYLDEFNITFSRFIAEKDIERECFRFLTTNNLNITIESNYMEQQNEIL